MLKYTNGIIIEKSKLIKGNQLLIFSKDSGLNYFIYPYRIKNLDFDPPNFVSFQIKKYTNYFIIKQAKVINYFENIRLSFKKKIISQFVLEIIKKTLAMNQKELKLFKLTLSFFIYLDRESEQRTHNIFTKYIKKYIEFLGYKYDKDKNLKEMINHIEKVYDINIDSKVFLDIFE